MTGVLFLKELREAFASRRFWVILVLALVLLPLGVQVSLKDYRSRLQSYSEAARLYQDNTKQVQDILYKGGAKAFAPPSPLSFLALGLELVLPNVAETPAERIDPPVVMRLDNNQSRDNLYEFFYGPLDLVFVVAVVMSLLAVVLTYGAIAGEKEQGTLALVLSNAVPRAKIVLAKTAANALVLVVPFLLAVTLSLTIVEIQGGAVLAAPGAWTAVGLGVLFSVLLIGFFANLGLLISALTKQAVPALVTLLLAWVFLYGVYPRLSAAAAQILSPAPSEAQVALEKAQVKRDIDKALEAEVDPVAKAMPKDWNTPAFKEGDKKQQEIRDKYKAQMEERWRAIDRDVAVRREARNALTAGIARLSPVSSFIRPMAELARTGWLEYVQFQRQAGRFEEVLNREIFSKQRVTRTARGIAVGNEADPNAPAPLFTYAPTPAGDIVRNVLPDLVLLAAVNLILFAGAFVAFLRYDAR